MQRGSRRWRWRGGEREQSRCPGERCDAVFIRPVFIYVCVCETVEDTAMSKATEGSHCNLCNRHKHVYCCALSHWRDGSHYNHVRCCVPSSLFGDVLCLFIMGIAEGRCTQRYDSSEDLWSEMTHFIFRKSLECINDCLSRCCWF